MALKATIKSEQSYYRAFVFLLESPPKTSTKVNKTQASKPKMIKTTTTTTELCDGSTFLALNLTVL